MIYITNLYSHELTRKIGLTDESARESERMSPRYSLSGSVGVTGIVEPFIEACRKNVTDGDIIVVQANNKYRKK